MTDSIPDTTATTPSDAAEALVTGAPKAADMPKEVGGPKEKDPTRYGDWTVKGRCIDF